MILLDVIIKAFMELEGESGAKQPKDKSHSIQSLMLQCSTQVAISYPSAFPQTGMQMDLQTSSGHDANNVVCVDANMLEHSCSSSEPSLLHSTSESPPLIELEDSDGGQASVQQQWSYEEQFRQLYNLSPDLERKSFLDKLFSYMQKKGTPITRIPIMAKQPLDMYKLFKLVVERGGLVEVIKKKAWRDIAKELNLPASITSAAFTMRSQYVKYLYPFECEEKQLSDPKELQLAIESNKRDRRHSDNLEYLSASRENERRDTTVMGQHTPFSVAGAQNALQLISSPTVAIPQNSIPPYSTGFIITPTAGGGGHMMPRLTSGGPQLLQMSTAYHPQILVPTSNPASYTTMIPVKPDMLCSPMAMLQRDRKIHSDKSSPVWSSNLIQINQKISESSLGIPNLERNHDETDSDEEVPPAKRVAKESSSSSSTSTSNNNTSNNTTAAQNLGMPFTNISIKPAVSGVTSTESSPSVLVTLELNSTVYQGVLFARPRIANSPSR